MKLSKDTLVQNVTRDIVDNSVGAVSPQDIRKNILDLIDSVSLLTKESDIEALNISTEGTRTTRLGVETLFKRTARGYQSVDNVAIGHAASKSHIHAERNTAIGSFALTCNMYGQDNVGVGFHALGSTINGFGNVGVGSYSLNANKEGNFNIAIGHGAGYYVERDKDYQFFVAAHPIDDDYICANKDGTGLVPLMLGDMSSASIRLGVGTNSLHEGATLQVGGNIHPSMNGSCEIGSPTYRFTSLYITKDIDYPNSDKIAYTSSGFTITNNLSVKGKIDTTSDVDINGNITATGKLDLGSSFSATSGKFSKELLVGGDITPDTNLHFSLGDIRNQWKSAHIYNLFCNGIAQFNKLFFVHQTHFRNKTLFLGYENSLQTLDGGGADSVYTHYDPQEKQAYPSGSLIDEELDGAGIKIASSGVDYYREYELSFKPINSSLSNLSSDTAFSRSSWSSNISISTAVGTHVETDRVISSGDVGIYTYDNDFGLSLESGVFNFGQEKVIDSQPVGMGDFNVVANSGKADGDEHVVAVLATASGVNLYQDFLDRTDHKELDGSEHKKTGFRIGYTSSSTLKPPNFFNEFSKEDTRRFVISSYNNSSANQNCLTVMQSPSKFGCVGISNFENSESMLPDTMLNARSKNDAVARFTSENTGTDSIAAIQLLGKENFLKHGVSIEYNSYKQSMEMNAYDDSNKKPVFAIHTASGTCGILNPTCESHAYLSIGSENYTEATISLYESTGVPVQASGYGQIFTRESAVESPSMLLGFMDGSGNIFNIDMTQSSADGSILDKALSLDTYGNTFGGLRSPINRNNINATVIGNTSLGYEALAYASTGRLHNTVIGYKSGNTDQIGSDNVVVGSQNTADGDKNILIGKDLSGVGNQFKLGYGDSPLIYGDFSNNLTYVNGMMYIKDPESTIVSNKCSILGYDRFTFGVDGLNVGTSSRNMMRFISGLQLNNIESYNAIAARDYVYINADLKLRGSLLLADGSVIHDGTFLNDISDLQTNITDVNNKITQNNQSVDDVNETLSNLVIEGFVITDISPSDLPNSYQSQPLAFYIRRQTINRSSHSDGRFENAPSSGSGTGVQLIHLRDPYLSVRKGDYVIAMYVNGEYRPISITGAP
jgi:hypothetical protein